VIEMRKATEADLPEILRLDQQLDGGDSPLTDAEAKRIFALMATYPDYAIYVAEEDGVIVGSYALVIIEKLAHRGRPAGIVEDVVVEESRRGQGIGELMMKAAMDHCRERGCYKMALSSNLKREAAHAFYERLGFQRHGYSYQIQL